VRQRVSFKHVQRHVAAHFDPVTGEMLLRGCVSQLRAVVVAAQVAEPYVSQVGGEGVGQELGRLPVAEVPRSGGDPPLQVKGVLPVA